MGLLSVALVHAGYGIHLFVQRLRSRPIPYAKYISKGEPSLQSLSSRTMIVTGSLLAVFIVTHLLTFKFGPYYLTQVQGREVRDLARLVVETFQNPTVTLAYTAVMVLLGFHLRHGLWSALQSLGAMSRAWQPVVYLLSLIFAIAITIGFVILPLAIYVGAIG